MSIARVADREPRPDPVVHPDTEPFWAGLARGDLLVQRCGRCGTYRYPFAPVCHRCRSFELSWEPLSPDGTVAAAVTVHRATGDRAWASHVPFTSGTVDMDHGLRLPGRITCTCGEARSRGTAVRAVAMSAPDMIPVLGFVHGCVAVEP